MKTAETKITKTIPDSEYPILEEQDNGILQLTLNRPEQLNSLSESMLTTLQMKLDATSENKDVKLVILQGTGKIMACNMMAEDVNEGIDAFVQKQTAVWKGK